MTDAFKDAKAGDKVVLSDNASVDAPITVDKDIVFNLNGNDLNVSGTKSAFIVNGATLTIEDENASQPSVDEKGTVTYDGGSVTGSPSGQLISVQNGGKLIVNSGKINATSGVGVYAIGNTSPDDESEVASTVEMNGGYINAREFGIGVQGRGAVVDINGGVIEAQDNAVVGGNGTNSGGNYSGGTSISIDNATLIGHTISSGYIGCGVYHPQKGTLVINNTNMNITNGMGVLMRGGTLEMSDTNITTTGTMTGKVGDSKVMNGCYGVCVDTESKYYDSSNIDCTLTNVNINTESESVQAVPSDEETIAKIKVVSGTFSTDPTAYAKDKTVKQEDGKYKVS